MPSANQELLSVLREVLGPMIWADQGELYLVMADDRTVALHLRGRFSGCPGNTLVVRRIIEPLISRTLPNARVMIHQPSGGFSGQASDIEIHAKEVLYLKRRLNEMMAEHTGQPIEVIERDTDRDNFMGAEDALKYGLVDRVLKARTESPVA